MTGPFTYDGEPCQIGDNINLVQALERCAAAYHNRCVNNSCGEHPDQMWVRLYSATERLKQAICRNSVARTILEIGSDLMGCNDMAILALHANSTLSLLAGSGMNGGREQELSTHAEVIASAIEKRQISIVNTDTPFNALWSELGIAAFVPVWHENTPRGAIIFYRFLSPQSDLDLADRELLRLLSMFAGPSLFST